MAEKKVSLGVVTLAGEDAGKVSVNASVFGVKDANEQVIHDAVTVDLANRRQATAKTKKRHEVHGTNKKPWRQKGTGRARAGDCKSPIWVGGGIVFGPAGTQNYKLSQNKKAHKLALRTVLSEKAANGMIVVDSLALETVSSKAFAASLKAIKAEGKVLVIYNGENANLVLSAKNIDNLEVKGTNNLSVYDVLNANCLVVSKDAVKEIEEALK